MSERRTGQREKREKKQAGGEGSEEDAARQSSDARARVLQHALRVSRERGPGGDDDAHGLALLRQGWRRGGGGGLLVAGAPPPGQARPLGRTHVYVCDHASDPPKEQCIRTDDQPILIRSLLLRQKRATAAGGEGSGSAKKKRKSDQGAGPSSAEKKARRSAGKGKEKQAKSPEGKGRLESLTKEQLQGILRQHGVSSRGLLKHELVEKVRATEERAVGGSGSGR